MVTSHRLWPYPNRRNIIKLYTIVLKIRRKLWVEFWVKKQMSAELAKPVCRILLTMHVMKAADFKNYHLSLYCVYVVFCERPSLRRPDVNTFLFLRQGIFTSVVFYSLYLINSIVNLKLKSLYFYHSREYANIIPKPEVRKLLLAKKEVMLFFLPTCSSADGKNCLIF